MYAAVRYYSALVDRVGVRGDAMSGPLGAVCARSEVERDGYFVAA